MTSRARDRNLGTGKSCRPRSGRKLRTLADIVAAYKDHHRRRLRDELASFRKERSLASAVARAARAERPDGKRYDHQRRIKKEALRQVGATLLGNSFHGCADFASLHERVRKTIGDIHGVGELMVYDTALRIAAKRGCLPTAVYVHSGTRQGVGAMGLDTRRPWIPLSEFQKPLRPLKAHEIEDLLCIFKDDLRMLRS